jgi:virginiamycin A acetyltransferase
MAFVIGKYSYINDPHSSGWYYNSTLPDGTFPKLHIGRYTSIGKNCQFVFTHHNYKYVSTFPEFTTLISRGNIHIGNDVWIGMNVTIMDNVTIGDGTVVGAGAIVSSDLPAYAIVVGNPARVIKYRFSEERILQLLRLQWWTLERDELNSIGIKTDDIDGFIARCVIYQNSKVSTK